jgi:alpha-L-rhamnosidase
MPAINSVVNAYYYQGLVYMGKLAAELHLMEESAFYFYEAGRVKESFNLAFWDKNRGRYKDSGSGDHASLQSNVFALAFGLVPKENVKKTVGFIKSKGMMCSVYCSGFLIKSLFDSGEGVYAISLLTQRDNRSWWAMKNIVGSTMTLESWNPSIKSNMDWNHVWGASPVYLIATGVMGVKILSARDRRIMIRPQIGKLNFASIVMPVFHDGSILKAEYRQNLERGTFSVELDVPKGCVVDFSIPFEGKKIYELKVDNSEVRVAKASGIHLDPLGAGKHNILVVSQRD